MAIENITLDPTQGSGKGIVKVTVPQNTGEARSSKLLFKSAGGVTREVQVEQTRRALNPFKFIYNGNASDDVRLGNSPNFSYGNTYVLFGISGDFDVIVNSTKVIEGGISSVTALTNLITGDNTIEIQPNDTDVTISSALFSSAKSEQVSANITQVLDWGDVNFQRVTYFFSGGTSSKLTSIPKLSKGFAGITNFNYMFYNCSLLSSLPDGLFDNCIAAQTFSYTFYSCYGLTSIPENLFSSNVNVTTFSSTFSSCSGLTSIPENLFSSNVNVTTFSYTFYSCSGLTSIPENLFRACTKVTSFSSCFYASGTGSSYNKLEGESAYDKVEIDGVETIIHLYQRSNYPSIYTEPTTHSSCYQNRNKLDDYSSIPSGWK